MKIIRFRYRGKPEYGIIENKLVRVIEGSIFEDKITPGATTVSIDAATALVPVTPSKVVCVGLTTAKKFIDRYTQIWHNHIRPLAKTKSVII